MWWTEQEYNSQRADFIVDIAEELKKVNKQK